MKNFFSKTKVVAALDYFYGLKVENLTQVMGGADLDAIAYRADCESRAYFVKVKRGVANPVVSMIFKRLESAGVRQIIQPIRTNQEVMVPEIGNFHLIVFPYVEGQNGFEHELKQTQWAELGRALNQIHSIEVSSADRKLLRREDFSSKWREQVRAIQLQIKQSSPVAEETEFIPFMQKQNALITQLVDQTEALYKKVHLLF